MEEQLGLLGHTPISLCHCHLLAISTQTQSSNPAVHLPVPTLLSVKPHFVCNSFRTRKPWEMVMNTLTILLVSCIFLSSGHIARALFLDKSATEKIKNTETEWANHISFHPMTKQEWRSQQNKRISEGRKTQLTFKVTYANGTAIKGARLRVKQIASDFQWGCGMTHRILNNTAYKKWFASRFTAAGFHNEMKWYYNEKKQGHENYTDADAMVKFAQKHGISVRGHTILWDDSKFQQDWVKKLSTSKLRKAVNRRIDSVVKRCRGKLMEWDVINENLHTNFYEKRLGKHISEVFFNRVYNLDPNAILFMNEYNTLEYVEDKYAPAKKYLRELKKIKSYPGNEGMKTGIGLESHFGPETIDIHYIRRSLSKFSKEGSPIWLTELDVKVNQTLPNATQLQVHYLEEILREVFSHSAVKGIIMWTGSAIDGCKVMCMTDENLNNTPIGDLVDTLIAEWRTGTVDLVSDHEGSSQASLFHGHYEATLVDPVTNASTTLSLKVDNTKNQNTTVHVQIKV